MPQPRPRRSQVLTRSDSVIIACVQGVVIVPCCALAGATLSAMLFALFTLDVDSAFRAAELTMSGLIIVVLPVGIAAGLVAPWVLALFRLPLEGFFSLAAALAGAVLAGLVVLVQAALVFSRWGFWIGLCPGALFGIAVTWTAIADARRGRGQVRAPDRDAGR